MDYNLTNWITVESVHPDIFPKVKVSESIHQSTIVNTYKSLQALKINEFVPTILPKLFGQV